MINKLNNKFLYTILYLVSLINLSLLNLFAKFLSNFSFLYRKGIVQNNITNAFPKSSDKQINVIVKKFYFYFFRMFFETIKMISADKSFYNKRIKFTNPELLEKYKKENKSVILMLGHHNNWEWSGHIISLLSKQQFICVYKKFSSKFFNNLMIKLRSKFGIKLVEMNDIIRFLYNDKSCKIIGLISDQNPNINTTKHWTSFFNQTVPVIDGGDKIARKMNYPVLYVNMTMIKSGYYNLTLEVLEENPSITQYGEIADKFIKRLEKKIIEEPNSYLWSHNRWKHKK